MVLFTLYFVFGRSLQKPDEQEPEEEEGLKHIDPLHQLIQLFSRTALTEKWYVSVLTAQRQLLTNMFTTFLSILGKKWKHIRTVIFSSVVYLVVGFFSYFFLTK